MPAMGCLREGVVVGMQDLQGFYAALAVLASALGCGLLMGIERERRKGSGPHRALAGVRSFTTVWSRTFRRFIA